MTPQEAILEFQWYLDMPDEADISREAVELAIAALEKQIPKKIETRENVFLGHAQIPVCPRCRAGFNNSFLGAYCQYCGQLLD